MPRTTPPGKRERNKAARQVAMRDAAVALFLDQGYERTTVDQIASAAGVSPRTFFRYFTTKDDILYSEHAVREAAFEAFLAGRAADEPVQETMRAAAGWLAADLEGMPEFVAVQTELWFSAPKVALRFQLHHEALLTILAKHIARRIGVDEGLDLRPRMAAGLVVRAWLTATRVWVGGGADGPLTPLVGEALDLVTIDI